jgi:uncharacterized protein (TIGR03000 family)
MLWKTPSVGGMVLVAAAVFVTPDLGQAQQHNGSRGGAGNFGGARFIAPVSGARFVAPVNGAHFGGARVGAAHFGGARFGGAGLGVARVGGVQFGAFRGGFSHGGFRSGGFRSGFPLAYYGGPVASYPFSYGSYVYPYSFDPYGYPPYDTYPYVWPSPTYDPGYPGMYGDVAPYYGDGAPPAAPPAGVSQSFYPPATVTTSSAARAHVTVNVPAGAQVWFDNHLTTTSGSVRQFDSPVLTPGGRYGYVVRARWNENGREVTQTQQVAVTAGANVEVAFPQQPTTMAKVSETP